MRKFIVLLFILIPFNIHADSLKKANQVGWKYLARWYMEDGVGLAIQILTEQEYKDLALPRNKSPRWPPNRTWGLGKVFKDACSSAIFDTPSGGLEDGYYAEFNGRIVVGQTF